MKKIIFYAFILLIPLPALADGIGPSFLLLVVLFWISVLGLVINGLSGIIGLTLYVKKKSTFANLPAFVRMTVFPSMALGVILLLGIVLPILLGFCAWDFACSPLKVSIILGINGVIGFISVILYLKKRNILANLPALIRFVAFSNMVLGIIFLIWLTTFTHWSLVESFNVLEFLLRLP